MATLQELIAQKEAIEREIEKTKQQGRAEAIEKIRSLMLEYGLSIADISARPPRTKSRSATAPKGSKIPAKYRDASTGETWSGRGLQPRWLKAALAAGRRLEDFAV